MTGPPLQRKARPSRRAPQETDISVTQNSGCARAGQGRAPCEGSSLTSDGIVSPRTVRPSGPRKSGAKSAQHASGAKR
jgi:hypothetical protein